MHHFLLKLEKRNLQSIQAKFWKKRISDLPIHTWKICLDFLVNQRLRPRLHGTGSARLRSYQIEYFQDECGS